MVPRRPIKSNQENTLRQPAWFRFGVVAVATFILCSCQAGVPRSPQAVSNLVPTSDLQTARFQTDPARSEVVPAIYREDSHTAPPAEKVAEYAAGIRPAGCPCHSDGYSSEGCSAELCGNSGPIVGPRDEYLCDGGDGGLPVGVRENWQVDGLEQEDTVAHYDTVDGRTVVTPSNQVCIYAPRFGVVRRVVDLREYARYDMPGGFEQPVALAKIDENEEAATSLSQWEPKIHRADAPPSLLRDRTQLGELDNEASLYASIGSLAPYADLQIVRAGEYNSDEKALLARSSLAAITWAGDQAPQVSIDSRHAQAEVGVKQAAEVYHTNDPTKPRLRLIKLASCGSAQPGKEIEFTLRFDNIGSQEMGNVTIMDNLTTRLEYVSESAKSSVDADFSTETNLGGSVILRWEIKEPLDAGAGGILQFRCKVR